jgi:hypothetical protein
MSGAIIGGGIAAAGALGAAGIGAWSSSKAADAQSSAANNAAQLQYKASQDALAFQKQQWETSQDNMRPWLDSGRGALTNLDYLLGIGSPGGGGAQGAPGAPGVPANGGPAGFTPTQGGSFNGTTGSPAHFMPQRDDYSSGAQRMIQQGGNGGVPYHRATADVNGTNGPVKMLPAPGGPNPAHYGGVAPTTTPTGVNPNIGGGFGSLMQGFGEKFTAPDGVTEQNDPGYRARLNMATDQIQRSAAARGNLLTGGTAKALDQFSQDYGSNEYGNVYGRSWNEYAQRYNQFNQDQTNKFNRLGALAGIGQQSASQLGYMGLNSANSIADNLLTTAGRMGADYQNAGAANASGYYNGGAAWGGALNSTLSNFGDLYMMRSMSKGGGGGGAYDPSMAGYDTPGLDSITV